jgi:hypothetical protein
MAEGQEEVKDFWAKHKIKIIGFGLVLFLVLGITGSCAVSYKKTVETQTKEIQDLSLKVSTSEKAREEAVIKTTILTTQSESWKTKYETAERERNKWVKKYNDQGVLILDEGSASSSSLTSATEELKRENTDLRESIESQTRELEILTETNKVQKKALETASKTETIRRDFLNVDFGGEWDLGQSKVKASLGVSKALFNLFGLSVNVRAGISQ